MGRDGSTARDLLPTEMDFKYTDAIFGENKSQKHGRPDHVLL